MCESLFLFFFFNDTATTEIYTLSLHDALPIWSPCGRAAAPWSGSRGRSASRNPRRCPSRGRARGPWRSATPDRKSTRLNSSHLVCRLLLEKKKKKQDKD